MISFKLLRETLRKGVQWDPALKFSRAKIENDPNYGYDEPYALVTRDSSDQPKGMGRIIAKGSKAEIKKYQQIALKKYRVRGSTRAGVSTQGRVMSFKATPWHGKGVKFLRDPYRIVKARGKVVGDSVKVK